MRRWLACGLLALVLPGCVTFGTIQTAQPQTMGAVTFTVSVCANGAPSCAGAANTGSAYAILAGLGGSDTFQAQLLYAVRLPDGAVPQAAPTGGLIGGSALTWVASTAYANELQALEPAPAGTRWWGWRSTTFTYGLATPQAASIGFTASLPETGDGSAYPSPLAWRPVVGIRVVDAAHLAARTVECGSTNQHLYSGINEFSVGQPTIVCVDAPAPDATRGTLQAPITDWGLEGTDATVPAGAAATVSFIARRTGAPDGGTVFDLAPSGGPPGSTVSLDTTSVDLGGDATQPVLATLTVPAGTAPGSYPLTVTGTAAGKPTRAGTATITVPAAGPGPTPAPTDTTAPTLGASAAKRKVRRGRRLVLRVALSEPATVTTVVIRKGRQVGRMLTRSLPAGASKLRLKTRKLRRGRQKAVLVARDAAGNASAARTVKFRVR